MHQTTWLGRILGLGLCCTIALPAHAQTDGDAPSDADRAAAQALFDEGRTLLKAEKYEKACAKFAESMRLDRAIGTQLNLANCYEQQGRLASAWINFEEARARATKAGDMDARVEVASQHANALAGRLSKLKIIVTSPVEGMLIRRDTEDVGQAQWGSPVPIDGGRHVIEASAPGKLTWRTRVSVKREGDNVEVVVPALDDAPVEPDKPTAASGSDGTGALIGAGVAGGLGLVGAGLGIAFGLMASSKNDESAAFCTVGPNECSAEGVSLRDDAFTMAHVSTTGFVVGGVGIATAAVLLAVGLSSASDEDDGAAVSFLPSIGLPSMGPDGASAVVRWSW
jgi:hypothetical protein